MFQNLQDQTGVTLVSVMIMLLMITILGAGLMTAAVMENKLIYSQEDQKQAYYLAQAGIEYARYQLQQDLTWRTLDETVSLGAGSYILNVQDDGAQQLTIRSLGTVGRRSQELEVGIRYTLPSGGGVVQELAQYTALGGGDITFKNSAQVDGDGNLRTNGSIEFQNGGTVDGELIAGGQVNGSVDSSGVTESAESYDLPVVDWEQLQAEAQATGRYYTGWNSNLLDGAVNYIDSSVDLKKIELVLDGILVIRGDFELQQASSITSTGELMIFVDGNVTFKNRMTIDAAIYASGSIDIQNKADITGALYAEETIEIKNNVHLTLEASHIQQTMVESYVTAGGQSTGEVIEKSMTLTYWKEI